MIGPGEVDGVDDEADYEGSAVAAVAAETFEQAEAAVRLIESSGRSSSRCSTPTRRCARARSSPRPRRYERGDYERGLAEADAVVEAEYRTQTLNHNPIETHQCVCQWRGDALDVYVSTQCDLGGPQRARGGARAARPTRCA